MKSIKYFFALLTFTFILSCSKDDDIPSTDQSLLVGEWNLEEYNYSGTTIQTQGGVTKSATFTGEFYDIDYRLFLNSDNSYKNEGSYKVKLTGIVEGETSVQSFTYTNVLVIGTYQIENNKIITTTDRVEHQGVQVSGTPITEGTIVELTDNKLVIIFSQNISEEMDEDSIDISVEGRQVFSR